MVLKIGCVTHNPYPTPQEIRITRFAAAMATGGNETVVFCPRGGEGENGSFAYGKIRRFGLSGILRWLSAPLPYNPLWEHWLTRCFAQERLDLVMVRDLRLALPAIRAAHRVGIPAVLDIGEHYPGLMEMVGKQKFSHHLTRNVSLIALLEKMSVRAADEVWVVAEENRERLSSFTKKIVVISNYPYVEREAPSRNLDRPFTFISLGLVDNLRGLDLVIDAFSLIAHDLPEARILIYGDGVFKLELERRVRTLGLDERVVFAGWVEEVDKYEALMQGDIGLLLHRPGTLTQHTMPNKLFDYMHCGLPVLATNLRPIERILDAEGCGLTVNYDTTELGAAMLKLALSSEEQRRVMGEKGRVAVRERYNWQLEVPKLLERVSHLTQTDVANGVGDA